MRNKKTTVVVAAALSLCGCAGVRPLENDQQDYIKFLEKRIEVLEKRVDRNESRTDRNEAAILGVNRRVNGLADLVSEPGASETSPTSRKGQR